MLLLILLLLLLIGGPILFIKTLWIALVVSAILLLVGYITGRGRYW